MEYRTDKTELIENLRTWNKFFKLKVHLIACGGTAMTLQGVKASTKDVDFMVPEIREYKYLKSLLADMGYKQATGPGWKREGDVFHFDLFQGNRIHTTGMLESPLTQGRNRPML